MNCNLCLLPLIAKVDHYWFKTYTVLYLSLRLRSYNNGSSPSALMSFDVLVYSIILQHLFFVISSGIHAHGLWAGTLVMTCEIVFYINQCHTSEI